MFSASALPEGSVGYNQIKEKLDELLETGITSELAWHLHNLMPGVTFKTCIWLQHWGRVLELSNNLKCCPFKLLDWGGPGA